MIEEKTVPECWYNDMVKSFAKVQLENESLRHENEIMREALKRIAIEAIHSTTKIYAREILSKLKGAENNGNE